MSVTGSRPKRDVKADLERAMELFPRLNERREQLPGTLSGGEQQMLAMARAMMLNPDIVLLDEPSMGLAPILVEEVFRIIARLKSEGVTMLLVEQFAAAALNVADYGYVLENGKIAVHGPAEKLKNAGSEGDVLGRRALSVSFLSLRPPLTAQADPSTSSGQAPRCGSKAVRGQGVNMPELVDGCASRLGIKRTLPIGRSRPDGRSPSQHKPTASKWLQSSDGSESMSVSRVLRSVRS